MKVYAQGFKSIHSGQNIALGKRLTFLVGPNSAGKSALMHALKNLAGDTAKYTIDESTLHINPNNKSQSSSAQTLGLEWIRNGVSYGCFSTRYFPEILNDATVDKYKDIHKYTELVGQKQIIEAVERFSAYKNEELVWAEEKRPAYQGLFANIISHIKRTKLEKYDDEDEIIHLIGMNSIAEVDQDKLLSIRQWILKTLGDSLESHELNPSIRNDSSQFTAKNITKKRFDEQKALSELDACGVFKWDAIPIRYALSKISNGPERQRVLNAFDKHCGYIRRLRNSLTRSIISEYPGKNIQLTVVSADRGLPSGRDLEDTIDSNSDSDGAYIDLMGAGVDAAWDSPYGKSKQNLLEEVNKALSDHLFVDNGYQIQVASSAIIPEEQYTGDFNDVDWSEIKFVSKISLSDSHGRSLQMSEVGSGIGYVLPVVIECLRWSNKNKVVFLQQPELHLHPALQASLADLLIESSADRRIVAETHSEHMILRVLRRIRQTTSGRLNGGGLAISPEDVAVNYFEPLPDGTTKVHILRISPDGDFLDRWPHGFFAERDKELFDE